MVKLPIHINRIIIPMSKWWHVFQAVSNKKYHDMNFMSIILRESRDEIIVGIIAVCAIGCVG